MKIRKIFAGMAAAVMAVSMMSMAASANTPLEQAISTDGNYTWSNVTLIKNTDISTDMHEAGATRVIFNAVCKDQGWGWANGSFWTNSKQPDDANGWRSATFGCKNSGNKTVNIAEDQTDFAVEVEFKPNDDTWYELGYSGTTEGQFEVVNVEFYAGEDLIGTWADGEYKPAIETIDTVDLTVVAPQPGETVTVDDNNVQTPLPEYTIPSDGGYKVRTKNYIDKTSLSLFEGTFESDVDYGVAFLVVPDEGYQFAKDDALTVKINGSTENVKVNSSDAGLTVIGAVKSKHVDIAYTAEKTDGYTYTLGSDEIPSIVINRSIGNDKTFGLFKSVTNGDKELVKDTDFTAESGSLKLALTKAYLNSLAAGDYTFKVAFEDGEAEFKLTVAEAPKTEEPKTEEPKTEEPKNEEPKTEDPKTEDPKTEDPKDNTPPTGAAAGTLAAIALVGGVAVVASRKRK